ncbi:MAG TPA: ribonuclease J [Clostridiales bacterium]|nr:ribonuclease J [Clostridiales bacterium]
MPNNTNRNRSRQASERSQGSSAGSIAENRQSAEVTAPSLPVKRSPRRKPASQTLETRKPAVQPKQVQQPSAAQQPRPKQQHSQQHRQKSAKQNVVNQASSSLLKIIPLGGMREIGKNLTVYEYDDNIIIVDCGIAFPEEDMPGIDVVIPDFSYLIRNKEKIRGIFLTHGHEDHIGALPWLCKDIKVPIYGNRLTLELVRLKLEDRGTGVTGVTLHPIKDGVVIPAGPFSVEFIHVNHSIADANALAIRTPAGIIFHSGDFKIDYTPINGGPIDLARIAAIGQEGVLAMVCESTNVERPGHSSSESKVGETFADLFGKAAGRIMVATFSSNVFRMQQIFTAAEHYNRKVALIGRSMVNVFNAANSLGYITMRPDTLIDINQLDRYDADEIVIITTGSQGEPMSALTRMAFSEHRRIEILPEDTVIISASPIPGNEKPIYRVINELFKRGAHVVYESLSEIHVSGHAYSGELKLLHSLVRPRYFIPGHGEYRHLYKHAELANLMGVPWENIFLLNNGDMFEYQDGKARIGGFTSAGGVLIDGAGMVDIDNPVLRDRRLMAEDGIVTVFIGVNHATGEMIGEPDIQARGFIYESEADRITRECKKRIDQFARKASGSGKSLTAQIQAGALRELLNTLLFERTRRRPIILISVIEI